MFGLVFQEGTESEGLVLVLSGHVKVESRRGAPAESLDLSNRYLYGAAVDQILADETGGKSRVTPFPFANKVNDGVAFSEQEMVVSVRAEQDQAKISRREHYAIVYLVEDASGDIDKVILPPQG